MPISYPPTLLASNQSVIFVKTANGWSDPSTTATNAIRVNGTPSWSVRGAGIIDRKEVFTPWGGSSASRTGGLGWDITFQTEFFWRFNQPYDVTLNNQTQLAALWLASPWAISHPSLATQLGVQPFFYTDGTRGTHNYAVQPFSIAYEEEGGKRFEASDCVCIPKISWTAGERIMIDWTVKGTWRAVTDSTNAAATYETIANEPPLIGVHAAIALAGLLDNSIALQSVTIDTGWTLNDVPDSLAEYGFATSFVRLDTAPTIEIACGDYQETAQPSWTEAIANTIETTGLSIVLTFGSNTWTISLPYAQEQAVPTPGDANGYRIETLKFQSIPDSSASPLTFKMTTSN